MKKWLITGSSSGLGRALAEAALQAGHEVVATARDPERLRDLAQRRGCRIAALDVTDPASVRTVVAEVGEIDVLVNNAGCGLVGALEECTGEQIRRVMEANFHGPLALIRAILPALRARRAGQIINVSAAAAIANYPGFGAYGAAKAALEAASESLRQELLPLGIHVSIVEPGPFRTDFIRRNVESVSSRIGDYDATVGNFARLIRSTDGRQPGDPVRAAQAILALTTCERPPLRLILGRYAHAKARRTAAEREQERAQWESLGLPTDFPPATRG